MADAESENQLTRRVFSMGIIAVLLICASVADVAVDQRVVRAASNGQVAEYPTPTSNSQSYGIVQGADGNVWFTEFNENAIAVADPSSGAITEVPVPNPFGSNITVAPAGITAGPPSDPNSVWFVEYEGNALDRLDLTTHTITRNTIPISAGDGCFVGFGYTTWPNGVIAGPDGNLWFTTQCNNEIYVMSPAGALIAKYSPPIAGTMQYLVTGPDGNVWFTQGTSIGVVCLVTTPVCSSVGSVAVLPVTGAQGLSGITQGPGGALWFTDQMGGHIGRVTTSGAVTLHSLAIPYAQPNGIAAGPDGNLWFTEFQLVGRITLSGVVSEVQVPTAGTTPLLIAPASDGGMWFTEQPDNIGRLDVASADAHALTADGASGTAPSESQVFSGPVATFGDADGNTDPSAYAATIFWGDNTSSDGTIVASGSSFTVAGSHTYGEDGNYTIAVEVTDSDASMAAAADPIVVADQQLSVAGITGKLNGRSFKAGVIATFTDPAPEGTSDYTAMIDWGDGTTSTGAIASTGGTGFSVSGSHKYKKRATYTVKTTITDVGGSSATATSTLVP